MVSEQFIIKNLDSGEIIDLVQAGKAHESNGHSQGLQAHRLMVLECSATYFHFRRAFFNGTLVFAVISGEMNLSDGTDSTDGVECPTLKAGDILIMPEGESQEFHFSRPEETKVIVASIPVYMLHEIQADPDGNHVVAGLRSSVRAQDRLVVELLRSLHVYITTDHHEYVNNLSGLLISHILFRYSSVDPNAGGPLNTREVNRALAYIHQNLGESLTVEQIAGHLGYSTQYFTRMFKKAVGTSPHQYLMNVRINKARTLLADGKYSIAEVAQQSGFYDQSHFAHSFRRIMQQTPTQYLRSLRS